MIGNRLPALALLAALGLAVAPAAVAAPAAAPVDLGGTEVPAVSTDPGNPTELTAGLWSDTLGAGSTGTHHFSYERTIENSTLHIGVLATSEGDGSDTVELAAEVTTDDGDVECVSAYESSDAFFRDAPFGTQIWVGPDEQGDLEAPCLQADVVRFSVGRGTSSETSDQTVVIKVVEEAPVPVEELGDLPATPETPPPFRPPGEGGSADQVEGATALDDAPTLGSGSYEDAAKEGEHRLYKVSLDWGQSLGLALGADPLSEQQLEETFGTGPDVRLTVLTPLRNTYDADLDGLETQGSTGEQPLRIDNAVSQVRYLDRFDGPASYLPGDYWVMVSVEGKTDDSREVYEIPYTLTVDVRGDAGDGAPAYDGREDPFLVGSGDYSTVASGVPVGTEEGASTSRRLVALGLGLFGLVCCGLGTLQLRRR